MYQKSGTKAYFCTASPGALCFLFVFVSPRRARKGDDALALLLSMASNASVIWDAIPWKQNMLRDNYIPCETRRDNYRGTITCGGIINFPTKNGGIITDQLLRI